MIAALSAIWTFLTSPLGRTVSKIGLALLLAGGLYLKGRIDGEMAEKNESAAQAFAAQKKADQLANELIIAQAAAMAQTEKTVTLYRDRIVNAPSTSTCGPALRDAADGVRAILGGPQAK